MRPNSPVQTTSVSSSRPRASRSAQQRGDRLVDFARLAHGAFVGVVVVVPVLGVAAAGDDLHEAHAALDQPARDQAARAEAARDLLVQAVELPRGLGLLRDVDRLGRGGLHAIGQLVGGDARVELARGGRDLRGVAAVQPLRHVERAALALLGHVRLPVDVEDRRAAGLDGRALVDRGEKAVAPHGVPPFTLPSFSIITTMAGRLSETEPSP